jgi:hypothetical protein
MRLVNGEGSEKTGACWMSALHYYTRNDTTWNDRAPWACVSDVVRKLCIDLNDWLESDEERGRVIGPHLFAPLGTSTGVKDELKRAFLCADYAVRKFTPIWLEIAGRKDLADRLRAVPEIVGEKTALFGRAEVRAVHASASASAATSAAYAATSAAYAATSASNEHLKAAGRCDELIALRVQLILDCCMIGERREVAPVCTREAVLERCQ